MAGPAERDIANPAVGWRYWQLGGDGLLYSVSWRRFVWKPGQPLQAFCFEPHPPPAPDCSCGVYANAELAQLREHGLCLGPAGLVVGRVGLWGRVVVDDHGGLRGQRAYPAQLALVPETVEAASVPGALAHLRAYRVPVSAMALDEAVGPMSRALIANQAMSQQASRAHGDEPAAP
ncbi:MAG: hypothetical protein ACRD0D_14035 [Acidimicrobiales bacterium]